MATEKHGEPSGECVVCMCDLDADTYCEFKIHADDAWSPSRFCSGCIDHMRRTQWKRFEDLIAKADCRAAVLRLCSSVPLTVHDHVGFECPTHGKECTQNGSVALLWDMASGAVTEPILVGAKQGAEREQFIANLKAFAELMEAEKKAELAGDLKPVA